MKKWFKNEDVWKFINEFKKINGNYTVEQTKW